MVKKLILTLLIVLMLPLVGECALIDTNATDETIALYESLNLIQDSVYVLFGQAHFYTRTTLGNGFVGQYTPDVYSIINKYPSVLSADYRWEKRAVQYHRDRGGVITMAWGMQNLTNPGSTANDLTGDPLPKILTGGDLNDEYLALLDEFYDYASTLTDWKGDLIPIIFRPFHEMDGTWFWWGKTTCSDAQYIALWQMTVDYLKDTKGLTNIIWCWCSSDINSASSETFDERYPGDTYVDMIGLDCYADAARVSILGVITTEANTRGKLSGLMEFSKDSTVGLDGDVDYWTVDSIGPIVSASLFSKLAIICPFANDSTYNFGPGYNKPDQANFVTANDTYSMYLLGDYNFYDSILFSSTGSGNFTVTSSGEGNFTIQGEN